VNISMSVCVYETNCFFFVYKSKTRWFLFFFSRRVYYLSVRFFFLYIKSQSTSLKYSLILIRERGGYNCKLLKNWTRSFWINYYNQHYIERRKDISYENMLTSHWQIISQIWIMRYRVAYCRFNLIKMKNFTEYRYFLSIKQ
jgi:hypothetical protein